ncbi:hypothetical protein, partial [Parafrankia discariae]|uniref:hypothetical protein n=1 Tax=Parafrankia discariae TaxID=365528 RepID=UPI001E6043B5
MEEYATKSKVETLARFGGDPGRAFETNAKRHDRKVHWWRVSVVALALGLVPSGAAGHRVARGLCCSQPQVGGGVVVPDGAVFAVAVHGGAGFP